MQTIKIMEIYKRVYKAIKYKDMNLQNIILFVILVKFYKI